jgi:orotate phosphoribosyltransferase
MAEILDAHGEEMIVSLYDMGEIGYMDPPGPDRKVADPDYPEEAFKELKSGRMSPHYVGMRNFTSFSDSLPIPISQQKRTRDLAVASFGELLDEQEYDHLLGIPQAMTCLSGLVAQARGESVIWLRVGEKSYGVHESIQGNYKEGEKVASGDNVITDGATKLELVEPLTEAGLEIAAFNVFVDREEGGKETVEKAGHAFAAVIGMSTINEVLFAAKKITPQQHDWATEYRRRTLATLTE